MENEPHKQDNRNGLCADNIDSDHSVYDGRAKNSPVHTEKSETEDNDADHQKEIYHYYNFLISLLFKLFTF